VRQCILAAGKTDDFGRYARGLSDCVRILLNERNLKGQYTSIGSARRLTLTGQPPSDIREAEKLGNNKVIVPLKSSLRQGEANQALQ